MRKKIWIAYIAIALTLIVGTYTMGNSGFPLLLSDTQMGKLSGGFENAYCNVGGEPPCAATTCSNYNLESRMTGDTANDRCDYQVGNNCNFNSYSGIWCIIAQWSAGCDHIVDVYSVSAKHCN